MQALVSAGGLSGSPRQDGDSIRHLRSAGAPEAQKVRRLAHSGCVPTAETRTHAWHIDLHPSVESLLREQIEQALKDSPDISVDGLTP